MTTHQAAFGGRLDGAANEAVARTAGVVSLAVLAVGLGGLALGIDWAWIAFPVGYGGVLPLAVSRARSRADTTGTAGTVDGTTEAEDDALAALRRRYAEGEIDDVEFERRLERLLETEDD
ncbi:SHOCT domain-containing protein [Halorientalis pallida]|uniref:SHOCT domain-containing protein n=1 Tax=Halorientalis pallida TaxID=2479928 RepID=A0A498L159_9EURY|nr:SHOCT domain-containing protein [Halorientalis pallida]RXK47291.1 SHOCT domain-containing protein [Halorientalis pallida]